MAGGWGEGCRRLANSDLLNLCPAQSCRLQAAAVGSVFKANIFFCHREHIQDFNRLHRRFRGDEFCLVDLAVFVGGVGRRYSL